LVVADGIVTIATYLQHNKIYLSLKGRNSFPWRRTRRSNLASVTRMMQWTRQIARMREKKMLGNYSSTI
jgi:hypothetical protein